jgi:hypothetical protein
VEEVLPAGEVNPIGHFKHSFNNKSLYKYSPARQVVGIVIENRANPILVKKYLLNLNLKKPQLLFLLKSIEDHLDEKISSNKLVKEPMDYENIRMLIDCRQLVEVEYRKLATELYENESKEIDNPDNRYDYAREMKYLETLPDANEKYKYLQNLIIDYTRNVDPWEENKRWNGESFLLLMTKERDRYYQDINFITREKTEEELKEENIIELPLRVKYSLEEFKVHLNDIDFKILVDAYTKYFLEGTFPALSKVINVRGGAVKKLANVLGQLYREEKDGTFPYEYLRFARDNISLFNNSELNEKDILKSNLYKYFCTNS